MDHSLLSLTINGTPIPVPTGMIGGGEIGVFKDYIIIILISVAVIAALLFFILGAVKWITSGGDKEKLENARRTLIYSIFGLLIVLFSAFIIMALRGLFFGTEQPDRVNRNAGPNRPGFTE